MASHVHCRVVSPRVTQPQDKLFPYIADEHPNIQSALSQSQPSKRFSHYEDRPSRTNLQDALSTTMSDCDNHEFPSVVGYTSRLFLHPAVSGQSVLSPSRSETSSRAPPA
jgi:hypothetical protein